MKYRKLLIILVVIIFVGSAGWYFYSKFMPMQAALNEATAMQLREAEYIAKTTADTYGGKTPKETLDLFISALRKEDVQIASKYFMLDMGQDEQKWVDYLQEVKNKGLMQLMADDIEKAVAQPDQSIDERDYNFYIYGPSKKVAVIIGMRLSKYSNLRKIQSI